MDSGIDGDLYRKVLGRYPTGVTLVTGMDGDEPLAMVIGSFVSVSMEPPLVGVLPGRNSNTWPLPEGSGSVGRDRLGAGGFGLTGDSVMPGLHRLLDPRGGRRR